MKTGIVLLLLVLGQFAYGDDESNRYICYVKTIKNELLPLASLSICKEGDILVRDDMKRYYYTFLLERCVSGTLQIVHFHDENEYSGKTDETRASCIYNGRLHGRRQRTEEQ